MKEAKPLAIFLGNATAEHLTMARDLVGEPCAFHATWDPETLAPTGPACGKPSVDVLFWKDRRVSTSCPEHGVQALTDDARAMVLCVVAPISGEGS